MKCKPWVALAVASRSLFYTSEAQVIYTHSEWMVYWSDFCINYKKAEEEQLEAKKAPQYRNKFNRVIGVDNINMSAGI